MRIDAGVEEGDEVTVHYDPMIAKVIAWAPDRLGAIERLQRTLEATEVEGVRTNARFLWQILGAEPVRSGDVSTRLLESDARLGLGMDPEEITAAWLLAAVARLHALPGDEGGRAHAAASPWHAATGFRMNGPAVVRVPLRLDVQAPTAPAALADETVQQHWLQMNRGRDGVKVRLGEREHRIEVTAQQAGAWAGRIDGKPFLARIEIERDRCIVRRQCVRFDFVEDTGAEHHVSAEHEGHFRAPMPGHVLDVRVAAGQAVAAGAVLMVLEAMKMEHSLTAPWDARVTHVHVETGQRVEEGADLVQIEPVTATS